MSKYRALPPQELIKTFLDYDKDTGIFTWKSRDRKWFKNEGMFKRWNNRYPQKKAGCVRYSGDGIPYVLIDIFKVRYSAHRLAWVYVHGVEPEDQIDHINGISTDNRICNLREVDNSGNARNQKRNAANTSGATGVHKYFYDDSKWVARIHIGGEHIHLGIFDSFDDAVKARLEANDRYNFHPGHGKVLDGIQRN